MIHFSCKWCGKRFRAPDEHEGKSGRCSGCGKPVWVRNLSQRPSEQKSSAAVDPMMLQFTCGKCGKRYRTGSIYAGLILPCRKCGELIQAPPAPVGAPQSVLAAQSAQQFNEDETSAFEVSNEPIAEAEDESVPFIMEPSVPVAANGGEQDEINVEPVLAPPPLRVASAQGCPRCGSEHTNPAIGLSSRGRRLMLMGLVLAVVGVLAIWLHAVFVLLAIAGLGLAVYGGLQQESYEICAKCGCNYL